MDKETLERVNAPYHFEEFPKWKYHPDGRTALVPNAEAESELSGEWANNPNDAAADRRARDESIAKADLQKAIAAKGKG